MQGSPRSIPHGLPCLDSRKEAYSGSEPRKTDSTNSHTSHCFPSAYLPPKLPLLITEEGWNVATATTIGATNKWTIVDLGAAGMNAMPEVRIQFHDIDGDGSEEMLLLMTQEDGEGFLMTDPMGIADTMAQPTSGCASSMAKAPRPRA